MTVGLHPSAVETALCGGSLGCPVAAVGAAWRRGGGPGPEVSVARSAGFGGGRADRCGWAAGAPRCCCRRACCCAGRTGHQGRVHRHPAGTTADPDRCREQRRGQFPGRL